MREISRKAKHKIGIARARLWGRFYRLQFFLKSWVARRWSPLLVLGLLAAFSASVYLRPELKKVLDETDLIGIETFRSLFQSLGGGLVGASAIAFAIVLFAMQTNVEKMPHGLFKRLSSDGRLLGAYLLSFLLSVFVMSLSLVPNSDWITVAVLSAFWATVSILWLFLFAYRRALLLINPVSQLSILVHDTTRSLDAWAKMADNLTPLLVSGPGDIETDRIKLDLPRYQYFQLNSHWTNELKRSISHTISYSRRYAEIGDHEVSLAALVSLLRLNEAYIRAKGNTFFNNNPFMNNPMSRDGVITETLEHLRQNIQIGIARGDEQQIEQAMRTMSSLVAVYLSIDYSDERASRTHAHLAAGYLGSAVRSVAPHKMVDVLMEGVRLLRDNARQILAIEGADEIQTVVEDIAKLAGLGIANEDYRPITVTAVEALASLTLDLLRSRNRDIGYAAKKIRSWISLLAELALATPETSFNSKHHDLLEPYYSGRSLESLQLGLTDLVNAVIGADKDDADAKQVAVNICRWADQMYSTERDLLKKAAAAKSSLAYDIVHWITHVTKLLLAVANSPVCDAHTADELRKHALWLVSTLSFVPDDKEVVGYLENYSMTETVFETAIDSLGSNFKEIETATQKLLLGWIFKCSKHETGRQTLGRGLLGSATLSVIFGNEEELKLEVASQLDKPDSPSSEYRARAADVIREFIRSPGDRHRYSKIDHAAAASDLEKLLPLLKELIGMLSPAE